MARRMNQALFLAWLMPSLALSIMFVIWAIISGQIESRAGLSIKEAVALAIHALEMGALWQALYGSVVYLILKRLNRLNIWLIIVTYLMPVFIFNLVASDTYDDLIGAVPWFIFAVVMAIISWFFASWPIRELPTGERRSEGRSAPAEF